MTDNDWKAQQGRPLRTAGSYMVVGRDPVPPPVRWLVKGLIPQGGVVALIGAPGSGKSAVTAALVIATATGSDWLGQITRPGVPVMVSYEAATSTRRRLAAALSESQATPLIVSVAPEKTLLEKGAYEDIRGMIQDARRDCGAPVSLMVIDSLQSATRGADENSSKEIGAAFGVLQRLAKECDLTIIVIAHNGRDGGRHARGTSFVLGDVEAQLFVKPSAGGGTIEVVKLRDGEPSRPLPFALVSAGGDLVKAVAVDGIRPDRVSPDQAALLGLIIQAGGMMPIREWERGFDSALLAIKQRNRQALRTAKSACKKKLLETGRIAIEGDLVSVSKSSASADPDASPSLEASDATDGSPAGVSSVSKRQNYDLADAQRGPESASAETLPPFRGRSANALTLGASENSQRQNADVLTGSDDGSSSLIELARTMLQAILPADGRFIDEDRWDQQVRQLIVERFPDRTSQVGRAIASAINQLDAAGITEPGIEHGVHLVRLQVGDVASSAHTSIEEERAP